MENNEIVFNIAFSCSMVGSSGHPIHIRHSFTLPDATTHQDIADQFAVFLRAMQFSVDEVRVIVDKTDWEADGEEGGHVD